MNAILPVLSLAAALSGPGPEVSPAELPSHPRELRFPAPVFELPRSERRRIDLAPDTISFLERDSLLPLVELSFAFRAGSDNDPPGLTGLAVLTGAMLTRGGSETLAPADLDASLEILGADLLSFVRGRRSVVRLSVPTWAAPEAVEIVLDLLTRPRFDTGILDVVRQTALEGLDRRNENPLDVLEREWTWLVLGRDHPAGRAPTYASLAAISRTDLLSFYPCVWRPDNMVAAISGDVSEALLARLKERVTTWRALTTAPIDCGIARSEGVSDGQDGSKTEAADRSPTRPDARVALAPHSTPQAKVMIGHRLEHPPGWSERERFALIVAGEILGGDGAISRLNGRLRTSEGLVYRASADIEIDAGGREDFRLFLETRADRVWRAVDLAKQEVARLRSDLVHPRELEIVRRTLLGNLRSDFDTAEEVAGYLAENALLGRPPDYWRRYAEAIETVTREEIRAVVREFLRPEDFVVLVVGAEPDVTVTPGAPEGIEILPRRDPRTLEPLDSGPGSDADADASR